MSWFDAAALVVIALAILDGATSGLAWAALETAVLVGSALLARALRPHAEPYVAKVIGPADPWVTHLLAFAGCACCLFGVLLLVHPYAKKWRFRRDRWFGGSVGLLNGALASAMVFAMAMAASGPAWESEARSSVLVPVVRSISGGPLAALLPDHAGPRARQLSGE